jgi:hypothetical protein
MKKINRILVAVLLFTAFAPAASAQQGPENLDKLIREKDSLFWQAYNNCDVPAMKSLFTDDIEFYHDKGGITNGKEALAASLQKNLCSNASYHLRRASIAKTVKVFPMMNGGKVYGALISGEHLFYITDGGKPEYLDGHARFTQLWIMDSNVWKMSRILSFDHKPAAYQSNKKEIRLTAAALQNFEGSYLGKEVGKLTIRQEKDHLLLTAGAKTFAFFAKKKTPFLQRKKTLRSTLYAMRKMACNS